MYYVPAFFETFLVLLVAVGLLYWVRRRVPVAGLVVPVLVTAVALPTLWGAVALWTEQLGSVVPARMAAMGFAVLGLLVSATWAILVRGRPVLDDDGADE